MFSFLLQGILAAELCVVTKTCGERGSDARDVGPKGASLLKMADVGWLDFSY